MLFNRGNVFSIALIYGVNFGDLSTVSEIFFENDSSYDEIKNLSRETENR